MFTSTGGNINTSPIPQYIQKSNNFRKGNHSQPCTALVSECVGDEKFCVKTVNLQESEDGGKSDSFHRKRT